MQSAISISLSDKNKLLNIISILPSQSSTINQEWIKQMQNITAYTCDDLIYIDTIDNVNTTKVCTFKLNDILGKICTTIHIDNKSYLLSGIFSTYLRQGQSSGNKTVSGIITNIDNYLKKIYDEKTKSNKIKSLTVSGDIYIFLNKMINLEPLELNDKDTCCKFYNIYNDTYNKTFADLLSFKYQIKCKHTGSTFDIWMWDIWLRILNLTDDVSPFKDQIKYEYTCDNILKKMMNYVIINLKQNLLIYNTLSQQDWTIDPIKITVSENWFDYIKYILELKYSTSVSDIFILLENISTNIIKCVDLHCNSKNIKFKMLDLYRACVKLWSDNKTTNIDITKTIQNAFKLISVQDVIKKATSVFHGYIDDIECPEVALLDDHNVKIAKEKRNKKIKENTEFVTKQLKDIEFSSIQIKKFETFMLKTS